MFSFNQPALVNEYAINEFGETSIINQTYIDVHILNTSQITIKKSNQEYVTADLTVATDKKNKNIFKKDKKQTITYDGEEYNILKVNKVVDVYGVIKYVEILLEERNGD